MNDAKNTTPKNGRRTPSMTIVMLLMLAAVIFAVLRIIPLTTPGEISNHNARQLMHNASKLLKTAGRADNADLYESAASIYQSVSQAGEVKPAYRVKAAIALAALDEKMPGHTGEMRETLQALHDQLRESRDRELLQPSLDEINARWAARQKEKKEPDEANHEKKINPSHSPSPSPGAPPPGRVFAKVGGETVTAEEILFAWDSMSGGDEPTSETMRAFVFQYLNMVLLADEARRRGLEDEPATALELKMNRIGALGAALDRHLASTQPEPIEAVLRDYFEKHRDAFPPQADFDAVRTGVRGAFMDEQLDRLRNTMLQGLHRSRLVKTYPEALFAPGAPGESTQ